MQRLGYSTLWVHFQPSCQNTSRQCVFLQTMDVFKLCNYDGFYILQLEFSILMSWQHCAYGLVRLRLKNHLVRVRKNHALALKHLVLFPQITAGDLLMYRRKAIVHIPKIVQGYEIWVLLEISWFLEYAQRSFDNMSGHLQPSLRLTLY